MRVCCGRGREAGSMSGGSVGAERTERRSRAVVSSPRAMLQRRKSEPHLEGKEEKEKEDALESLQHALL